MAKKKQLTLSPGMWRKVQGMVFEHVDSQKRVELHESVDAICVSGPQFICSGSDDGNAAAKKPTKKPTKKPVKHKSK
jgi:hypothetical protein